MEKEVGSILTNNESSKKESFKKPLDNLELSTQNNNYQKPIVLIIDENSSSREFIKKELKELECEIIEHESLLSYKESPKDKIPNVVIVDIMLSNTNGLKFIENLSMLSPTKHSTIIAISSLDIQSLIEKSIKAGASKFIKKPFTQGELKEILLDLIKDRLFCSNTNVRSAIDGLVEFCDSDMSAYRMMHKMLYLKRVLKEEQKGMDYYDCIAALISTTLKNHTISQLIDFLNYIKSPKNIIDAIKELSNKELLHSKIVNAIFNAEKSFINNGSVSFDTDEYKDIENLIKIAYNEYAYIIRNGKDAEYVWQYYYRRLSDIQNVSIDKISIFNELISKTLIHQLINGKGGTTRLVIDKEKIEFIFEPGLFSSKNIDKLLKELNRFEHDLVIYLTSNDDKTQIVAELRINEPKKIEPKEFQAKEELNKESMQRISAKEFLNEFEIDFEDIQNLKSIEDDIFEYLELFDYSNDKQKIAKEIASYFRSYGTQIIYLREFQDISDALIGLGIAFEEADYSNISDANLKFFPIIFSNLTSDLKKWREDIFIDQTAQDIHYLDASIIANCQQCASILKSFDRSNNFSDDSMDIEFF